VTPTPEPHRTPLGPDAYAEALAAAGAAAAPQLAAIGRAINAWGAAVSAQLTAALPPILAAYTAEFSRLAGSLRALESLADRNSGRHAALGDPCGNPHPPFTPPRRSQGTPR
jgi:hypothetical protein